MLDAVSVIFPNYNHALFIRERIESVLCQLRAYDEIIFLDDASTDDSVSIAKELLTDAPCKVVYEISSVNSGSTFCQWNKGFQLATKQWIWIAETDDSCHPDFLQRVLGAAINNGAHFAYAQSFYVDEKGVQHFSDFVRMNKIKPDYFNVDFSKPGLELVQQFFSKTNCIPNASSVVFHTSLMRAIGKANESFYFTGDWEFWIRLVLHSRVSFVAEELNYFRFHAATTRAIQGNIKRDAESQACRKLARFLGRYPNYVGVKRTKQGSVVVLPQQNVKSQLIAKFIRLDRVPIFTFLYVRMYFIYVKTKWMFKLPSRVISWVKRQGEK